MSADTYAIFGSLYHWAMFTKARMLRSRTMGIVMIDRLHSNRT